LENKVAKKKKTFVEVSRETAKKSKTGKGGKKGPPKRY